MVKKRIFLSQHWDEMYKRGNWSDREPVEDVKILKKHLKNGAKILDVGCGKGKDIVQLAKWGFEAYGLDISGFAINKIKENFSHKNLHLYVGKAENLPFEDKFFDAVYCNRTLYHLSTEKTILEINRVLKKGGLLLISVPQTMRVHGEPVAIEEAPVKNIPPTITRWWKDDYYRFSKYGLLYLFRDFTPLSLYETRTTFGTLIQQVNYFIAALGLGWLPAPIYFVNNLFGLAIDAFFSLIAKLPLSAAKRFDELVVRGLTIDYIFIAQKK